MIAAARRLTAHTALNQASAQTQRGLWPEFPTAPVQSACKGSQYEY